MYVTAIIFGTDYTVENNVNILILFFHFKRIVLRWRYLSTIGKLQLQPPLDELIQHHLLLERPGCSVLQIGHFGSTTTGGECIPKHWSFGWGNRRTYFICCSCNSGLGGQIEVRVVDHGVDEDIFDISQKNCAMDILDSEGWFCHPRATDTY